MGQLYLFTMFPEHAIFKYLIVLKKLFLCCKNKLHTFTNKVYFYSLRNDDKFLYKMEYYRKLLASKVTILSAQSLFQYYRAMLLKLYVLKKKLWNSITYRFRRSERIRFHVSNELSSEATLFVTKLQTTAGLW